MRPLLTCLALLLFFGCSQDQKIKVNLQDPAGKQVASIAAEVATSESARALGLMYRKEMGDDEGMLFVFPDEQPRSFWMKNTYVELDMVFLNSAKKVISIVERAVPLSETPRLSVGKAQYVLEIKGGRSKALGIREGFAMEIVGEVPAPTK